MKEGRGREAEKRRRLGVGEPMQEGGMRKECKKKAEKAASKVVIKKVVITITTTPVLLLMLSWGISGVWMK